MSGARSPSAPFTTRVPAKWVLVGEHSVLRGGQAVAMPYPELGLSLSYEPADASDALKIEPAEARQCIVNRSPKGERILATRQGS